MKDASVGDTRPMLLTLFLPNMFVYFFIKKKQWTNNPPQQIQLILRKQIIVKYRVPQSQPFSERPFSAIHWPRAKAWLHQGWLQADQAPNITCRPQKSKEKRKSVYSLVQKQKECAQLQVASVTNGWNIRKETAAFLQNNIDYVTS